MAAAGLPPPESTVPAALTTATSTLSPLIPSPSTAPITVAQPPQTTENNPGPQLQPGQKRQRRPSVRLGEIGDQPAATVSIESHVRRAARYPHWKLPKDSSSKSVKARSITNLVNGHDAADENGVDGGGGGVDSPNRKVKSKRAAATRRVRSNWTSSSKIDDGEEWMSADQSPAPSAEENWEAEQEEEMEEEERRGWGGSESRENNNNDGEEMPESKWSGVRTWLIELGLSRYTPVFEIHEVDDEVLPLLTLEDLKDMGINAVGSRRKMYGAILKLRKGFS